MAFVLEGVVNEVRPRTIQTKGGPWEVVEIYVREEVAYREYVLQMSAEQAKGIVAGKIGKFAIIEARPVGRRVFFQGRPVFS